MVYILIAQLSCCALHAVSLSDVFHLDQFQIFDRLVLSSRSGVRERPRDGYRSVAGSSRPRHGADMRFGELLAVRIAVHVRARRRAADRSSAVSENFASSGRRKGETALIGMMCVRFSEALNSVFTFPKRLRTVQVATF